MLYFKYKLDWVSADEREATSQGIVAANNMVEAVERIVSDYGEEDIIALTHLEEIMGIGQTWTLEWQDVCGYFGENYD